MWLYGGGTLTRQSEETSAVLVIRAWREPGMEDGAVRARLTQTGDADRPGWEQTVADGEEAILAAIRTWLHAFASR